MPLRHRIKQSEPLEERLANESARLRGEAKQLPPGADREILLRRVRQVETALHMSKWLRSPGLRPPA